MKPKEKVSPKKDAKGKGKTDVKTKGTKRKVRLVMVIFQGEKLYAEVANRVMKKQKPV